MSCLVFNPTNDAYQFSATDWPPHCTIAGIFATNWSYRIHREFRELIRSIPATISKTSAEAYFGPDRGIHVRLIEPTAELIVIHNSIIRFIVEHGGSFNEPHYLGSNFRPHTTSVARKMIAYGKNITFDSLTLVDMFPEGDYTQRKIIETILLNPSSHLNT